MCRKVIVTLMVVRVESEFTVQHLVEFKTVSDDARQGCRPGWADHRVGIQPIFPEEAPYEPGPITPGREVTVLLAGGQHGFSTKNGFMLTLRYCIRVLFR
jgi:hypothetical protein